VAYDFHSISIGYRQHNTPDKQQPQHHGPKLLIVQPPVHANTQIGAENSGGDTPENHPPDLPRHSALCDIWAEHDSENGQTKRLIHGPLSVDVLSPQTAPDRWQYAGEARYATEGPAAESGHPVCDSPAPGDVRQPPNPEHHCRIAHEQYSEEHFEDLGVDESKCCHPDGHP